MKNCSLWEGLTLEKFVKYCLLWEGPHTGTEEEHEEEGATGTKQCELTATSIAHALVPLKAGRGWGEVEELEVKLILGRKEG